MVKWRKISPQLLFFVMPCPGEEPEGVFADHAEALKDR